MNKLENLVLFGSNDEIDEYLELTSTDELRITIKEIMNNYSNKEAIKRAVELLNSFVE